MLLGQAHRVLHYMQWRIHQDLIVGVRTDARLVECAQRGVEQLRGENALVGDDANVAAA